MQWFLVVGRRFSKGLFCKEPVRAPFPVLFSFSLFFEKRGRSRTLKIFGLRALGGPTIRKKSIFKRCSFSFFGITFFSFFTFEMEEKRAQTVVPLVKTIGERIRLYNKYIEAYFVSILQQ